MSFATLPLISKLSGTVIRILGCNPGPMTLQGTNTYLVGTGPRRILIDAGDAGETSEKYVTILNQVLEDERATVEHLVVTHWHHDHIGGVKSIQSMLQITKPSVSLPIVWKLPRAPEDKDITDIEKTTLWQHLEDGQIIEVEGAELQVKHTPGHSTDHACLLHKKEGVLFSGDCILGQGTAVFEDLYDYILSLKKILELRPDMIYPGHGPVVEDPVARIQYYIKHRQEREDQIINTLREHGIKGPMSELDIVSHVYKETPTNLWSAAALNVEHHLQKLLKEGRVQGEKGNWSYVTTA